MTSEGGESLPVLSLLPVAIGAASLLSESSACLFLQCARDSSAGIRKGSAPLGEAWLLDAATLNSTSCISMCVCHFRQVGLNEGTRWASASLLFAEVKMKRVCLFRAEAWSVRSGRGLAVRVLSGK